MPVFIAGHRGMVGSAILRRLAADGVETVTRSHAELDLVDPVAVRAFLSEARPEAVVLAAAKVGGILANDRYPASFIHDNLAIQTTVIHQAFEAGVKRLLFLGSSCIYPRETAQPIAEEALLTGRLEPTNEPYAIAKIAGIKMCESYNRQFGTDYRSVMPSNLYGPGDNFHPTDSHVIAALIRRFHEAVERGLPEVTVWGTGRPRREFLHVDDLADACVFVMNLPYETYQAETSPMLSHLNVGAGSDVSIAELAALIAEAIGFEGRIVFDPSKPDGMARKLLDVRRLTTLGWSARIGLREGIEQTYRWYVDQQSAAQRAHPLRV